MSAVDLAGAVAAAVEASAVADLAGAHRAARLPHLHLEEVVVLDDIADQSAVVIGPGPIEAERDGGLVGYREAGQGEGVPFLGGDPGVLGRGDLVEPEAARPARGLRGSRIEVTIRFVDSHVESPRMDSTTDGAASAVSGRVGVGLDRVVQQAGVDVEPATTPPTPRGHVGLGCRLPARRRW
jgi:hypothetical protein